MAETGKGCFPLKGRRPSLGEESQELKGSCEKSENLWEIMQAIVFYVRTKVNTWGGGDPQNQICIHVLMFGPG